MAKNLIILIFVTALTSGCISIDEVHGQLATWHGVDADDLVSEWGAPYGAYTKRDGSRVLSYSTAKVVTVGAEGFERAQSWACQVDVTVDKNNKIVQGKWRGELGQCAEMIRPYHGPDDTPPAAQTPQPTNSP